MFHTPTLLDPLAFMGEWGVLKVKMKRLSSLNSIGE